MGRPNLKFQKVYNWYCEPAETRCSRQMIQRQAGIDFNQLNEFLEKIREAESIDIAEQTRQMDASLFQDALASKTSKMKELWYVRWNLLVHKSEQTHIFELSGDDHSRIRNEAKRRVSEVSGGTDGTGNLLTESTVLPEEIREDTG